MVARLILALGFVHLLSLGSHRRDFVDRPAAGVTGCRTIQREDIEGVAQQVIDAHQVPADIGEDITQVPFEVVAHVLAGLPDPFIRSTVMIDPRHQAGLKDIRLLKLNAAGV
ncbi:hypothetical protein D3C73_1110610 [compost metagenome]